MRNCKLISSILVMLLFILVSSFAGGANEGQLYYMPRNVVDNPNVTIDLAHANSLSASYFSSNKDFVNTTDDNLGLFRLRDSLYYKSSGDQASSTLEVTISSNNSWNFVNENNPTVVRPFSLKAICIERKNYRRNYNSNVSVQDLDLLTSTSLEQSKKTAYFKKSNDSYILSINTTSFTLDGASRYADYIREYEISIALEGNYGDLEPGYYSTTLTVNFPSYQVHEKNQYWENMVIKESVSAKSVVIKIRGYIGLEPGSNGGEVSYYVSSLADTYNMKLDIVQGDSNEYQVANVSLYYTQIVSSKTNNSANKFVVYVSPSSDYKTSGKYKFIKMNSEKQTRTLENTIYYDLNFPSTNSTKESVSSGTGDIPSSTFKLLPKVTTDQISGAGWAGGEKLYQETWELKQDITLSLTTDSLASSRQAGLYYSYIYFTLVTN